MMPWTLAESRQRELLETQIFFFFLWKRKGPKSIVQRMETRASEINSQEVNLSSNQGIGSICLCISEYLQINSCCVFKISPLFDSSYPNPVAYLTTVRMWWVNNTSFQFSFFQIKRNGTQELSEKLSKIFIHTWT